MNGKQLIEDFLYSEQIAFEKNVDLKTKTWIKRGGISHIWVQPICLSDFEIIVNWCQLNKVRFEVIGNTSNCYFLNDYNPELVISTLKLDGMKVEKYRITCDCGYNMARFAKYCVSHGIVGFEGFTGLPGTVGGAAINNSGCYFIPGSHPQSYFKGVSGLAINKSERYGSLISELVQSVSIILNGEKRLLTNEQLSYSHRNSVLKSKEIEGVVLSVTFCIRHKEDPNLLEKRAREFVYHRKVFQEHIYPNLGTIFSSLEFKKLPFFLRCIKFISFRIIKYSIKDPVKKQKLKTKFFLYLRGAGLFRKYVSEYGVHCFTWKDENADQAFKEYVDFIKRNTVKYVYEIDIKGERASEYF
jgi:UDP-N-acetylenolpyruvoylglucosamine reductase